MNFIKKVICVVSCCCLFVLSVNAEEKTKSLKGHLLSFDGKPVARAKVFLYNTRFLMYPCNKSLTEGNGYFIFERLPIEKFYITYPPYLCGKEVLPFTESIELKQSSDSLRKVRCVLTGKDKERTKIISIRRIDLSHGALMFPHRSYEAKKVSAAEFELPEIENGVYWLIFEANNKRFVRVITLEGNKSSISIDTDGCSLKGKVSLPSAENIGENVYMVTLFPDVNNLSDFFPFDGALAAVDKDGTFAFDNIAPGKYNVLCRQTGLSGNSFKSAAQLFEHVDINLDTILPLKLEQTHKISFSFEYPANNNIEDVRAVFFKQSTGGMILINISWFGSIKQSIYLPEGEYSVFMYSINKPLYFISQRLSVRNSDVHYKISFEKTGDLLIRLKSHKNSEVIGRDISIYDSEGNLVPRISSVLLTYNYRVYPQVYILPTTASGETLIRSLPEGKYKIAVNGNSERFSCKVKVG